jgi:hypothetical protein
MNRPNQRSKWRTFYVPSKKAVNAGLTDSYGRVYMVAAGGNLVKIKDAKACTANRR